MDALANEGHYIHDFIQFVEPWLSRPHDWPLEQLLSPLERAEHRLGSLAAPLLSEAQRISWGGDEEFPALLSPPIAVAGDSVVAPADNDIEAIIEALNLLDEVGQRCYVDIAVGVVVTSERLPKMGGPEIAWLPSPSLFSRSERARLLLRESVNAWLSQIAEVEALKGQASKFGMHTSAWDIGLLRMIGVASIEYELLRRLAFLDVLDKGDRCLARDEQAIVWSLLETFSLSLAPFLNSLPPLPLMKDFVCTAYPCWDRGPFYSRAFDSWGKGPVTIHPLTPEGELLVVPLQ